METDYDAVLIDVAPSINLLQTCAMTYARRLLIPVSMDPLSLQGAAASIETARTLSSLLRMSISTVALLPVMVDRRLQITEVVSASLEELSARTCIPLLPPIRTDTTVTKCSRAKQFLADFDPRAKAMEDYNQALDALLNLLGEERATHEQTAPSASAHYV